MFLKFLFNFILIFILTVLRLTTFNVGLMFLLAYVRLIYNWWWLPFLEATP